MLPQRLQDYLHAHYPKPMKVNPAILGGIVVDFGDKSIDLSVASRVNKLNSMLQRTLATLLRAVEVTNWLCRIRLMAMYPLHRVLSRTSLANT